MRNKYPTLDNRSDLKAIINWCIDVARNRFFDIEDYQNQVTQNPKIYEIVPTSSTDLKGTEKEGDLSVDDSYIYVVANNAGVLEWRRAATSTF